MAESRAAIGFAVHQGWAAAVGIAATRDSVQAAYSLRIETSPADDREATEPYHVAGGWQGQDRVRPPDDPAAAIERGLARQRRHTKQSLQRLLHELAEYGLRPNLGAVLAGGGHMGRDLTRLLASHAQIHIAEGDAVRESIERGLTSLSLAAVRVDRRLVEEAVELGGVKRELLAEQLRRMNPVNRGAWRKEERMCALGAWVGLFAGAS